MFRRSKEPRWVRIDDGCSIMFDPLKMYASERRPIRDITYVGWGGKTRTITADLDLGVGVWRPTRQNGIRRAVWDAAYGYVSGFRKRDILWFILTRSLSHTVFVHVLRWERKKGL